MSIYHICLLNDVNNKSLYFFSKAGRQHFQPPDYKASATCNSQFPYVSQNTELQKQWVINIRRHNIIVTNNSLVCNQHFESSGLIVPTISAARRCLKCGPVSLFFQWNNITIPTPWPRVWDSVTHHCAFSSMYHSYYSIICFHWSLNQSKPVSVLK